MRLSQVLNRQHIGFMFKKHWLVQGKRTPIDTHVEDYLKAKGINIEDALEFVKEKPQEHERLNIVGPYDIPLEKDKNHPDYKERPCYTLTDTNVLLEGISQAQVLTKTVIAEDNLPSKIEELAALPAPATIHENIKKAILSANVFDCEQKRLPKIKDKERPAFNFPRVLGITDRRRNEIITNKLVQLVEKSSDTEVTESKYVMNDVRCQTVFAKEEDLIQFQHTANILVTSHTPLQHDTDTHIPFVEIPDLYPVKYNVTLLPEHFYTIESKYPVRAVVRPRHPHTLWLHYNRTEVHNVFETAVRPAQARARALTAAFAAAAAYATQLHGEEVQDLPEPVYINCIQTDGQIYDFGVLQLNTLNVNGSEGTKNVWYCKNDMKLYERCQYFSGMPVLEKYNTQVYGYINAFYNC